MKFKDFARRHISLFARVAICIFAFCVLLKAIAVISPEFADFFNRYVSSLTRAAFAYITAIVPFSLAEAVIIMIVPLSILYLIFCAVSVSKSGKLPRHIFNLIGLICVLTSVFIVNFSIAYDCTPIEEKCNLDTENLTANDVFDACVIALDELKELEETLPRNEKGSVVMPYSFSEMTDKLNLSYKNLYRQYSFLSPLYTAPKRVALSKPMTYTGIMGVYTFFTGEANVNTNAPDYSVTFTAAHEMAHQRGIAPEDEANFTAFLVCYTSSDTYLRYCALVEIANFLSNTLYYEDEELFNEVAAYFSEGTINEYEAYSENYQPYSDNIVNDVASEVNDTYLKSQGQSEGMKSYDLVTGLATAYLLKNNH